jgi:hypothetical protein
MQERVPVVHGYFVISDLNMLGGDLERVQGIETYEEAVAELKKKINYDHNRCGLVEKGNYGYNIALKLAAQTNPSKSNHYKATSIFYGKRLNVLKCKPQVIIESGEKGEGPRPNFDYYLVSGLDMHGGDLSK